MKSIKKEKKTLLSIIEVVMVELILAAVIVCGIYFFNGNSKGLEYDRNNGKRTYAVTGIGRTPASSVLPLQDQKYKSSHYPQP